MSHGHYGSIDGFRGFALLLVLMFHQDIIYFGWIGMILFFVLSGYLITKVLMTEKEKGIPMKSRFRNFWMRRLLRTFPAYYLYLLILIIGFAVNLIPADVRKELPFLLTYTYNFHLISVYDHSQPSFLAGHFWSLSVEEQFYLFYPFLVFFSRARVLKITIVILICFSILFRIYYIIYSPNGSCFSGYSDYHPFNYLDSFLCGGAIFIFKLDKIKPTAGYLSFALSLGITIASGLWIYLKMNQRQSFNVKNYLTNFGLVAHYCEHWYRVWSQINLNLLFSSMILLLILPVKNLFHIWLKRIFEFQPLVYLGKISYGTYIFHAIIIWLMIHVFKQTPTNKYIFFLECFTLALLFATAIYYLYEKKFLAMKDKFR